jgi:hypothetical protein
VSIREAGEVRQTSTTFKLRQFVAPERNRNDLRREDRYGGLLDPCPSTNAVSTKTSPIPESGNVIASPTIATFGRQFLLAIPSPTCAQQSEKKAWHSD